MHPIQPLSEQTASVNVLIVDDSIVVVEALTNILSDQDYGVESCNDGESGWDRLVAGAEQRNPMPDLLLLDLNMPGIDGLTLLRRMRADERFALLPVIILTVEADPGTRLAALQAGANDYLPKPVQTVELLARVEALLNWKLAERLQQRRMEHLIEAGRTLLSTLDLDSVLQRVMHIVIVEMNAEGASIWLRDSDGNLMCRAASGRGTERLMGMQVERGQGIVGWALQHKQSVLVPDAQADPRFYARVEEQIGFRTRSLVAVPLLARGTGVGVLETVNKKREPFSPADLAWLEALAPLAAAAITNAQLFQELQQRTVQLQTRNEELDTFAHTVAHDLKTPLASIVGFAETLKVAHSEIPKNDLTRYLHTMARNGRKMSRIIDELLLLAGVRKAKVEMRPLNMPNIVSEAMQRLDSLIAKTQAEIILPETWPIALGYGPWVEEVWVNYLSNGIKYGGQPPRVELGATPPSIPPTEGGMVRFWVRDNGPGITEEAQVRLFTPFTQIDSWNRKNHAKGHGLGLSIVRRIVEKLGGQVEVESKVGQGSTFTFILPGVPSDPQPLPR